jgi:sugar phosphate isomerase/epimerase
MGADPIAAVRRLGSAIYYTHAKDTRVEPMPTAIDGTLDPRPTDRYEMNHFTAPCVMPAMNCFESTM